MPLVNWAARTVSSRKDRCGIQRGEAVGKSSPYPGPGHPRQARRAAPHPRSRCGRLLREVGGPIMAISDRTLPYRGKVPPTAGSNEAPLGAVVLPVRRPRHPAYRSNDGGGTAPAVARCWWSFQDRPQYKAPPAPRAPEPGEPEPKLEPAPDQGPSGCGDGVPVISAPRRSTSTRPSDLTRATSSPTDDQPVIGGGRSRDSG